MTYKNTFVLLCKTYAGDIIPFKRLWNSCKIFNKRDIPFYAIFPKEDYSIFKEFIETEEISFLFDEEVSDELVTEEVNGFSPGYINQQIIKMSFFKTGLAANYFCLDSDSFFIKDFSYEDFMFNHEVPYTILSDWQTPYWDYSRKKWIDIYNENIEKIQKEIDFYTKHKITCSGLTILSSRVLSSFFLYLENKKSSILTCLTISPFEFSWYNQWLLKTQLIPIYPVSGLFLVFHFYEEYKEFQRKLLSQKDLEKKYIGMVMNSNWSKYFKVENYQPAQGLRRHFIYYLNKIAMGIRRRKKEKTMKNAGKHV